MNYSPSINVETRVHISTTPNLGQSGISAGIYSPSLCAVSEANRKLKTLEVKALEQEKSRHIRRFVFTLISTVILGTYLYSSYVSEDLLSRVLLMA